ncbi:MAG: methyltransferase domain-containing protein [Pedobacter sp.]|uniref:class I SAM-dependent methyltransferase n=1 Tax=Pedobacter sp. TaxID=1411316 RepID=UPI0028068479|nr:methyltransferase domain-containing protein [Pedobacter sp.]MDQ8005958.1 methyltransferase domain-containing protein [Pedobacter sp.]
MPEIHWDSQLYNEQHRFVSNYGADVLQWLDAKAGEHILDVGCGTGDLAAKIQEAGATVSGVDASADMVELAKREYPTIQFEQKDAAALDYNREFDAVFSNATFHWIENQRGLLRGIYKSLKHGGRLVAEFGGKGNIKSIIDAIETAAKQLGLEHRVISNFWFFPSISHYATLLEASGFETEQMWLFDRPTQLVGEDGMQKWINQFAQHAFVNLNEEEATAVTSLAIEILKPTYFKDGQWTADYRRLRIKAIKK